MTHLEWDSYEDAEKELALFEKIPRRIKGINLIDQKNHPGYDRKTFPRRPARNFYSTEKVGQFLSGKMGEAFAAFSNPRNIELVLTEDDQSLHTLAKLFEKDVHERVKLHAKVYRDLAYQWLKRRSPYNNAPLSTRLTRSITDGLRTSSIAYIEPHSLLTDPTLPVPKVAGMMMAPTDPQSPSEVAKRHAIENFMRTYHNTDILLPHPVQATAGSNAEVHGISLVKHPQLLLLVQPGANVVINEPFVTTHATPFTNSFTSRVTSALIADVMHHR